MTPRRTAATAARLVAVALVAGLGLCACGAKSSTGTGTGKAPVIQAPTPQTTVVVSGPATAAATPTTATTAATASAATASGASDAAIDQQIQSLSNSLDQVNGDVSNADKASANGG